MRLRIPLVALLLIAIAALATPAPAGTQPTNAPTPAGPMEVDGLLIELHDLRWVPDLTHSLRLGGTLVEVSITNIGDTPHDFYPVHFSARTSTGEDAIIWLLDEAHTLLEIATIEPGESLRGDLLFMTGLDAGPITITRDPSFGADPSRVTTWQGSVDPRPDELNNAFSSAHAPGSSVLSSDRIDRFHVEVVIQPDGSVEIRERITYDFGTRPGRGIVRDLVTTQRYDDRFDRRYPFALGSVSSETAVDDVTIEHPGDGITRLKIGDPDITHTGTHTYEIHYRLDGTLNDFEDHQEWYWNVTGHEWDVPIVATEITVVAPAAIVDVGCWAGPVGVDAPCTEMAFDGDSATFSQAAIGGLYGRAGVTVAVMLPAGTIADADPILHERWSLQRAFGTSPATLGGAGVLGGLGVLMLVNLGWRHGRDRQSSGGAVAAAFGDTGAAERVPLGGGPGSPVEFVPPEDLRPAQMGMLMNERATDRDVTATIIDLAVRGWIRIEEVRAGAGPDAEVTDHELVRVRAETDGLHTYETLLMEKLFDGAWKRSDAGERVVKLSELKTTFRSKLLEVQSAIAKDAVANGWFPTRPDHVRGKWIGIGAGVFVLAALALIPLVAFTRVAWLGVPPLLFGFALMIIARWMPHRTPRGTGLTRRCHGFRELIEGSESDLARFAEQRHLFTQYLPYAVGFGAVHEWVQRFKVLGLHPEDMTWFSSGTGITSLTAFEASLQDFTASSRGALRAAAPSTSGGSGGSSFSSGGGGGGFSGGGGGGGGGGRW